MPPNTKEGWIDLAKKTLTACEVGLYEDPDGELVSIEEDVRGCVAKTREYGPSETVACEPYPKRPAKTVTRTTLASSLTAAHELCSTHSRVAVLNFASARSPGGGFQRGSMAQEESLAYASALFPCLDGRAMYEAAAQSKIHPHLYDDWVIFSPNVPVIRSHEDLRLLEHPWLCSFITCAAPNTKAHLEHAGDSRKTREEIERTFRRRIERVLHVAARHQVSRLVLGAWGCGVFGGDPELVARLFDQALRSPTFANVFEHIVFAIYEHRIDHPLVKPFANQFGT